MKNVKVIIPAAVAVIALIAAIIIALSPSKAPEADTMAVRLKTAQQFLVELDYDRAIAEFEAIIQIDPMNVDAYIGLAEAYKGKGDIEKAIEVLEEGYSRTGDESIKILLDDYKAGQSGPTDTAGEESNDPGAMIRVPDTAAVSLTEKDAVKKLEDLGFKTEVVYSEIDNRFKAGTVKSQSIVGEFPENKVKDTVITLEVYVYGLPPFPSLIGMTQSAAIAEITALGMEYNITEVETTDETNGNKIASQSIPENTDKEKYKGQTVELGVYVYVPKLADYFLSNRIKSIKYWAQYDKGTFYAHNDTFVYENDGLIKEIRSDVYKTEGIDIKDLSAPWDSHMTKNNYLGTVSAYFSYDGDVLNDKAVKVHIDFDTKYYESFFRSFIGDYEFSDNTLKTRAKTWLDYEIDYDEWGKTLKNKYADEVEKNEVDLTEWNYNYDLATLNKTILYGSHDGFDIGSNSFIMNYDNDKLITFINIWKYDGNEGINGYQKIEWEPYTIEYNTAYLNALVHNEYYMYGSYMDWYYNSLQEDKTN